MKLSAMKVVTVGLACCFVLAAPLPVYSHDVAPAGNKHSAHVHQVARATISANATALAPVALPRAPARETDGLSRDSDDCNMGCIDH